MSGRSDSIVFSPGLIGSVEIKNRLVRSATMENGATPDGEVTRQLVDMYRRLAEGGAGLIVTGFMNVHLRYRAPGPALYPPARPAQSVAERRKKQVCMYLLQRLPANGRQPLGLSGSCKVTPGVTGRAPRP